jgi:ribosome-binding protein aMBF1 (putative translation factor)
MSQRKLKLQQKNVSTKSGMAKIKPTGTRPHEQRQFEVLKFELEKMGNISTAKRRRCTTLMRRMRAERHLSQFDIGIELGFHSSLVSRYERGQAIPTENHIYRLERFFGVPVAELLEPIYE